MKRLFATVLLTAVLSAQMSWAAGTEPPVDLDPAEEQTLLHVGREYRFYFTDAQGEIPDPEFWEGCTLEAELDEEEEREYTETFEVRADEAGRLYLAVSSPRRTAACAPSGITPPLKMRTGSGGLPGMN